MVTTPASLSLAIPLFPSTLLLTSHQMAPSLSESAPEPPHALSSTNKSVFPDGLKTSGQHPPVYSRLRPYPNFPKHITGPTVWRAEDYRDHPERWTHVFSEEEIAELGGAADDFLASGVPLTGITRALFPLPKLGAFFGSVRNEILNGKGERMDPGCAGLGRCW